MFNHEPIHTDWLTHLPHNEYNVLHEIRAALQAKQTAAAPVRIRDLMPPLELAYNTIARAIKNLESKGLIRASSGSGGTVRTFQIDPSAARPNTSPDTAPLLTAETGAHPTPPTPAGGVSVGEGPFQEVPPTIAAQRKAYTQKNHLEERDLVASLGLDVPTYFALSWMERWYMLHGAQLQETETRGPDDPMHKLWKDQTPDERDRIRQRVHRKAVILNTRRKLDEELAEWKAAKDRRPTAQRTSPPTPSTTDSEQPSRTPNKTSTSPTTLSATVPTGQPTLQPSSFINSQTQPLPA